MTPCRTGLTKSQEDACLEGNGGPGIILLFHTWVFQSFLMIKSLPLWLLPLPLAVESFPMHLFEIDQYSCVFSSDGENVMVIIAYTSSIFAKKQWDAD